MPLLRVQKKKKPRGAATGAALEEKEEKADAAVPGTQKVWMRTFGCSHNVSDSEYMQGQLDSYGYQIVENKDDADVWCVMWRCHDRTTCCAGPQRNSPGTDRGCVYVGSPGSSTPAP